MADTELMARMLRSPGKSIVDRDKPTAWSDYGQWVEQGLDKNMRQQQADLEAVMGTGIKDMFPNTQEARQAQARLHETLMGNMFIGSQSNLFDPDRARLAIKLLKEGVAPKQVWKELGTGYGLDKKLRQEISDKEMKTTATFVPPGKTVTTKLPEVVEHPQLFEAYPGLKKMRVEHEKGPGLAYYLRKDKKIRLPTNSSHIVSQPMGENERKNTLVHELQHAIQHQSGFQGGNNPEHLKWYVKEKYGVDLSDKDAYELYMLIPGEVEARLAQRRQTLDDKQRRQFYPFERASEQNSYGVDRDLNDIRETGERLKELW